MPWPESSEAHWPSRLAQRMHSLLPQLRDTHIASAWNGLITETSDLLPRVGDEDGIYYCAGCNGSGVAMMVHLGDRMAGKVLGETDLGVFGRLPLPAQAETPAGVRQAALQFLEKSEGNG